MLAYNGETLSQIAFNLGCSNIQNLSNQFKKIAGITPSQFKLLGLPLLRPIDSLT
ncbi:AraC family transcriptional regulator [Rufibacter sp. LB8]|uniref:helix-turn-helix domain-containing protein n=1 Tax=Rufibacter sp. LB8 TaxID=2777781 RepID=UPI00178C52DC